jgi:hypothetical protein
MMKRLLTSLPLLALGGTLLLPGCRPPEDLDRGGAPKLGELSDSRRGSPPPRQGPGEDGASGDQAGDGDGVRLSSRGLGKEDYALIEAEIRCVKGQFKDNADELTKAQAAIMARYGASEDWVERVRAHLNGEPDVATRLEEMVARRLGQICVDGTISPELLAATPAGDAPSGDAPSGDAPSGDAPSGDAPAGDAPSGDAPAGDAPIEDAPSEPPAAAEPAEGGAAPE